MPHAFSRAALIATLAYVFVVACASLLIVATSACGGSVQQREMQVRTALEVLHDVIDPAYDFADQACTAREREAVERYEKPPHPAQAKADYYAIKERCVQTRQAFRAMRDAHARAAQLLEDGQVRQAAIEVERVRETWRALEKGKPP